MKFWKKLRKKLSNLLNPNLNDVSVTFSPKAKWDDGIKPTGFSFKITRKF